jgi:hypothetical protein
MQYTSPELVVIGRAEVLVLGEFGGPNDNVGSLITQPAAGIALGLDD